MTSFAYAKIDGQFEDSTEVQFISINSDEAVARGGHAVNRRSCTCEFFTTMNLICKHIFKFLEIQEFELYDPSLCSKRWTKMYYEQSHPALDDVENVDSPNSTSFTRIRCPEEKDKYRKTATVTKEINNLAASMSKDRYSYFLEKITALRNEMFNQPNDTTEEQIATRSSRITVSADVHNVPSSKNSLRPRIQHLSNTHSIHTRPSNDLDEIVQADAENENDRGDTENEIVRADAENDIVRADAENEVVESDGLSEVVVADAPCEGYEVEDSPTLLPESQKLTMKLPNKIKQIGRPKGSGLTVIGTKRKAINLVNINSKKRKVEKGSGSKINVVAVAGVNSDKSKKKNTGKGDGGSTDTATVADVPAKSKKNKAEKGDGTRLMADVPAKATTKFVDLNSKEQGKLIVKWLTNFSVEELQLKKVINFGSGSLTNKLILKLLSFFRLKCGK